MSIVAAPAYSRTASIFHWAVAAPMMGSIGAVLQAQRVPKPEKQYWMYYHESLGMLTAIILVPRLGYRLLQRSAYNVADLPGTKTYEKAAALTTFASLQILGIMLSVTGVAMNYYGSRDLLLFGLSLPVLPKTEENKKKYGPLAYQMYNVHKQVGYYGKYLIPLHMAGSFLHAAKGQAVFARINPFQSFPKA